MSAPSLEDQIISQVEFYFSPSNLRRDKFMKATISSDPDGGAIGFCLAVPLSVLMTFNRLKKLSEDKDVILSALKKSENLILINEGEKIKSKEIPTQDEKIADRCVHLRGLPTSATLDDIIKYLKPYGDLQYVEMRRFKNREFKGTVNIEFKTEEEAEEFLKKDIQFAGVELKDKQLLSKHNEEKKVQNVKYSYSANSLLQLKIDDEISRDDILVYCPPKVLEPYQWEYFYLDYKAGNKNCVARLQNAEVCEKAKKELLDATINGKKIKPFILRGKQAIGSWSKIKNSMKMEEANAPAVSSEKRVAEDDGEAKKVKEEEKEI